MHLINWREFEFCCNQGTECLLQNLLTLTSSNLTRRVLIYLWFASPFSLQIHSAYPRIPLSVREMHDVRPNVHRHQLDQSP